MHVNICIHVNIWVRKLESAWVMQVLVQYVILLADALLGIWCTLWSFISTWHPVPHGKWPINPEAVNPSVSDKSKYIPVDVPEPTHWSSLKLAWKKVVKEFPGNTMIIIDHLMSYRQTWSLLVCCATVTPNSLSAQDFLQKSLWW